MGDFNNEVPEQIGSVWHAAAAAAAGRGCPLSGKWKAAGC